MKPLKIVLGVTGSIAAYKSAFLIRLLVKSGHQVRVVMTQSAHEFITPLTLSTLSQHPVLTEFKKDETGVWNNHVELGTWADLILIAPCSANTLSKMANGICDNLLLATYLSSRCPTMVAPAMDLDMWSHASTQNNIKRLIEFGNIIIEPEEGELASGLSGKGRMAEPEHIVKFIENFFSPSEIKPIALVTAGPTHEYIDPVRFITNASSGKMGLAIAWELWNEGFEVILVHGPIEMGYVPFETIKITTAEQMAEKTLEIYPKSTVSVFAAAVADYTPTQKYSKKIKKTEQEFRIKLKKTTDIAKEAGKLKKQGQFNVGFALETHDEEKNALKKLKEKNFDMIVLNSLNDEGAGFGYDTNKITILGEGFKKSFPIKSKKEVGRDIVREIILRIRKESGR